MPWKIKRQQDGKYCVVNEETNKVVKCHGTESEARAHVRALYSNVKDVQDDMRRK